MKVFPLPEPKHHQQAPLTNNCTLMVQNMCKPTILLHWCFRAVLDSHPPSDTLKLGFPSSGASCTFGVMLLVMQKARCCRMLSMLW